MLWCWPPANLALVQYENEEMKKWTQFMQLRKVGFFTQLHKLRSLRRSFLHFHFISAVHIRSISYIINTSTVCDINGERKLSSCCMKANGTCASHSWNETLYRRTSVRNVSFFIHLPQQTNNVLVYTPLLYPGWERIYFFLAGSGMLRCWPPVN